MTVEDRIAALEAQVAELKRVVAERPVWHSMARTLTCPTCGGGSILVVKQVKHLMDAASGKFMRLTLNPTWTMWRGAKLGDSLFVYVCKNCRLVEWRVESIEHLVPDGETIVELKRPDDDVPADEPYR